jgi:hypothetical protein
MKTACFALSCKRSTLVLVLGQYWSYIIVVRREPSRPELVAGLTPGVAVAKNGVTVETRPVMSQEVLSMTKQPA